MKNSLFLLLIVLACMLSAIAAHVVYVYRRGVCRIEFEARKHKITQRDIQTIAFPMHARIDWEKKGKEFLLDGKLYDVISIRHYGLITIVVCVEDVKEYHVMHDYLRYLQKSQSDSHQSLAFKVKTIKCLPIAPFRQEMLEYKKAKVIYRPVAELYSTAIEVHSPPPEDYYALSLQ
jgi:hypothetical protein